MKNAELKKEIKEAGFFLWEVADKLGMNDGNFSRLLRKDLSEEKKQQIYSIMEELKKERAENAGN